MADAGAYAVYADARTRIRDAAKWIVSVLASAIVVIIGGGLIANIPTLDTWHIVGASMCLFGLTVLCVIPLLGAIDILVAPFSSFQTMTEDPVYADLRSEVEPHLAATTEFKSMAALLAKRTEVLATTASTTADIAQKKAVLESLGGHIRETIELRSTYVCPYCEHVG